MLINYSSLRGNQNYNYWDSREGIIGMPHKNLRDLENTIALHMFILK